MISVNLKEDLIFTITAALAECETFHINSLEKQVEYVADALINNKYGNTEILNKALDKAVELAYEYRIEADTLSCSSCPMFNIFDKCRDRGLYQECSKRWKEELLKQAEEEVLGR